MNHLDSPKHGFLLGFVVFKLNMETIFNSNFHLDGRVELWICAQRLHYNIHLFTDIIESSADCRSQKVSKQNQEIQVYSVPLNRTLCFTHTYTCTYTIHIVYGNIFHNVLCLLS